MPEPQSNDTEPIPTTAADDTFPDECPKCSSERYDNTPGYAGRVYTCGSGWFAASGGGSPFVEEFVEMAACHVIAELRSQQPPEERGIPEIDQLFPEGISGHEENHETSIFTDDELASLERMQPPP